MLLISPAAQAAEFCQFVRETVAKVEAGEVIEPSLNGPDGFSCEPEEAGEAYTCDRTGKGLDRTLEKKLADRIAACLGKSSEPSETGLGLIVKFSPHAVIAAYMLSYPAISSHGLTFSFEHKY